MSLFLGTAYLLGTAVTKDPKEAEHWYNHGAGQGEPGCMFMLGILFEQRALLATSLERAYFWYTLAEAYKHPAWTVARSRLVTKLSPLAINRLDAEAAAFKPK
jgi:TPR repeat protein